MKKRISRMQKEFLEKELRYLKEHNAVIEMEPLEEYYLVEDKRNQAAWHTFLWVGAVLVGIGFLSFIASNWSALTNIAKYCIILLGVVGFYLAGYRLETKLPRTARSLYYIGIFLFGSGIFLIGQTFHLGGAAYQAFLLWGIGIIPLAYYLKDRALLAFATILFFLYSLQIYEQGDLPLLLVVFIPLIYYINHHGMHQCKLIFFMNSLLLLHFLHSGMWYAGMNQWFIVVVLFTAGIIASRIPLATYKESMVIVGHVVHGIYGIVLTMPFIWERLFSEGTSQVLALIFAVAYGIYIILLIRGGKLLPIAILCGLIFRFYIDISYDFLPKSLFFIIGGFLLIAFGIWFERSRRGEAKS